jgi:5-formyltetrahydrofolate cyclo-ligase
MIDKQALRQDLRQRRRSLSVSDISLASSQACKLLRTDARFQSAQSIAIYSPFSGEIDPTELVTDRQTFYLPVIDSHTGMHFVEANLSDEMHANRFGILEPQSGKTIAITSLDMIVLPLVAFNRRGDRLGMGAGFYDRALANLGGSPYRVGIAYSWQEVDQLTSNPWDVPLHAVVTDKEIIPCC